MDNRMTELSGGQTRALLIADATVICSTPVVLLDEVENAGIHRTRAVQLLRQYRKIFIFVTHDPRIALLSDFRIVMQDGRITKVLHDHRRRARRFSACQPAGRRPLGLAGETAPGDAAERRGLRSARRSHETRHLCRAGHDRQNLGASAHHAEAAGRPTTASAFLKLDVQYADEDELLAKRVRHSHAQGLFGRTLPRPLPCDGPGRRAALGREDGLRRAAGRDGRTLPALLALCRWRAGDGGPGSHERHEPAAEGRADALAGRHRRGHEDRPRFAGRTRGVSGADSGRRPATHGPRGQRPARHRHRSAGDATSSKAPKIDGTRCFLRGNPPVGTCTICVGKKEIGWQSHFGVVRRAGKSNFYRGE